MTVALRVPVVAPPVGARCGVVAVPSVGVYGEVPSGAAGMAVFESSPTTASPTNGTTAACEATAVQYRAS